MISDTKTQNVIVVVMVILGLFSGLNLAGNASFYSGTFLIESYLQVELEEIRLTDYDPDNITQDFELSLFFSFVAPITEAGEIKLDFLTAAVYLNGEKIKYKTFKTDIPAEKNIVTSGYNETFAVSNTITEIIDKNVFFNATAHGEWTYSIKLIYFYIVFDSGGNPFREIYFAYTGE